MSGRVEADPHLVLRLERGECRALRDRVGDARLEIIDLVPVMVSCGIRISPQ